MYQLFSRWGSPAFANDVGMPTDSAARWSTRSGDERRRWPTPPPPPVVADDVGALEAEVVEHRHQVADEERDAVALDVGRLVGAP